LCVCVCFFYRGSVVLEGQIADRMRATALLEACTGHHHNTDDHTKETKSTAKDFDDQDFDKQLFVRRV
jgi:hypothetical protein